MTELVVHQSTELSIVAEQQTFTPAQRTALSHIGVENATDADIEVFFHVVKRTGLDPFARQIYMIGRNSKMWDPRTKQERWITKFTIQTGIDGYRLIGRRAANAAGATLSVKPVQWAHKDGGWRDVWMGEWGQPVAARVTILRSGEEFTATALFDEYKQTTKQGELTQMWRQRPAGQIGKCAEALAWRMAFPQDLSGIYVEEEMQQADSIRIVQGDVHPTAKDQVRAAIGHQTSGSDEETTRQPLPSDQSSEQPSEPEDNPEGITSSQSKKLHASFNELGITARPERLAYASKVVGRELKTSNEMTKTEASQVIEALVVDLEAKSAETPPDTDALWEQIVAAAGNHGMSRWDVETDFAQANDDTKPVDASVHQLEAYLKVLTTGEATN